MIDIIITSYKEPKATVRAINTFLSQEISDDFKITVVDPFPEVEKFIKKNINDKRVHFFLDPGEGKGYALNLLFDELYSGGKDDIFILTDGDVFVSQNSVSELLKKFEDKSVGCVTGKPVSVDPHNTKYGFWAKVLFGGADMIRKKLSSKKEFFECSGYLFAIRKGVLTGFPLETSEDGIIPYLFWEKGYKIDYADNAEVYVKNPNNWKDWANQRIRNIKGHENLTKIAPEMKRTKSFFNEAKMGTFFVLRQPKNLKEFWWILQLFLARGYVYFKAFSELRAKKTYTDGWRETEIESTKPLD